MRSPLAFWADVLLGPACPHGCGYRARGHRTLYAHCQIEHAGDRMPPRCRCNPDWHDLGVHAPDRSA